MAPRPYWKGHLRLSLVSCPIALYPATGEGEKVSFHQINSETGNRIRYKKVDAETGEEVDGADIIKGYEASKGRYIQIEKEELEAVEVESTKTIDIDEFVPREEIDDLYVVRPYFIAPEGKVGQDAFITIREAIEETGKVALGRIVLTSREHIIALQPRGKGIVGTLLRYPYEVRDAEEYFDDIPDMKIPKEMLDLAKHIVATKAGHFKPDKFEDRYEKALVDLIQKKAKGQKIEVPVRAKESNVVDLMDALKRSIKAEDRSTQRQPPAQRRRAAEAKPRRKQAAATRKRA
jgi:DNA end-binding protein Ku